MTIHSTTVEVEIDLDEISTEDLQEELASRNAGEEQGLDATDWDALYYALHTGDKDASDKMIRLMVEKVTGRII